MNKIDSSSATTTEPEAGPSADGALTRLGRDPVSRSRFLKVAGGTGVAGALSAFLAACGGSSSSSSTTSTTTSGSTASVPPQFGKGDTGILNYALTLEYLETAFYQDVVASGLFKGSDLDTIKTFGSHEAEHVAALTAAVKKIGGTPAKKPKTKFPLKDANSVLQLAATVENLGAAAYLGQAPYIQSPQILASALAIHAVEGRHAATLNTVLGKKITPDGAFAKPADSATVLKSVQPFIVG
ncbi:MAG: ferritin-like domain-containing protein [Solirubrobacterales bacterium]